jgi:hypothetical protein
MRSVPPVLLLLFVVSACADAVSPPPTAPLTQLRVGFPPGGLADTIRIDAVDRLPLRIAQLVTPDGATIPANSLDVAATPRTVAGQWIANDPWRNGAISANISGVAQMHTDVGAALQSQQQLLANVSSAEIPLPDPVAYRRDWARYRIRLTFGTPPSTTEIRELAAPQPPPPPPAS